MHHFHEIFLRKNNGDDFSHTHNIQQESLCTKVQQIFAKIYLFQVPLKPSIFSCNSASNRMSQRICDRIRGKSLLEPWGTTFLPDWQPPLIFV